MLGEPTARAVEVLHLLVLHFVRERQLDRLWLLFRWLRRFTGGSQAGTSDDIAWRRALDALATHARACVAEYHGGDIHVVL